MGVRLPRECGWMQQQTTTTISKLVLGYCTRRKLQSLGLHKGGHLVCAVDSISKSSIILVLGTVPRRDRARTMWRLQNIGGVGWNFYNVPKRCQADARVPRAKKHSIDSIGYHFWIPHVQYPTCSMCQIVAWHVPGARGIKTISFGAPFFWTTFVKQILRYKQFPPSYSWKQLNTVLTWRHSRAMTSRSKWPL